VLFCRILGPLQVEVDGAAADLGGPTVRRALTALLAADSEPVSDDALAEHVWGVDRPDDVPAALRVVIHRLRAALGPAARDSLQRSAGGYAFVIAPEFTDRGRFTGLVEDGLRQLEGGDPGVACKTLSLALNLWRGEPFGELTDDVSVSGGRNHLTELREVAVEELCAAQLARGDTARAVAALSEAVTSAPYRERRWELLALALYRSGRQSQALSELRRVRKLLVDELGVEPGPALRTIEQRILDHDPSLLGDQSPPSSTGAVAPTRPPSISTPMTSLVGRAADLSQLADVLVDRPLVTLLGPAGVGKTRLALEHAAAATSDAWVVRLADTRAPDAVPAAVAEAMGLLHADRDPADMIVRVLAQRTGLLVLDNCEHLVEAIAHLVQRLLQECPQVRILTTSRCQLGIDGEQIMTVEPLTVCDSSGGDGPAVALLLDRVRANHSDWQPVPQDLDAARQICGQLDGLPLAIELAAARERAFGLPQIAAHLRARIDVLAPTPRGSLSPHASLNAAISWSVDQLDVADRAFLLRLWPFEGGFTWSAAAAVQPAGNSDRAVLAVLASLVDRSVIAADTSTGRYRLLETVRLYCKDADPDPVASEEAHAAWVHDMVARQVPLIPTRRIGEVFRSLTAELANIRAGLSYTLERDPLAALRTAAPLEWVWVSIGALHEGMQLIRRTLDECPEAPVADRVRGLNALAIMSYHAGEFAATVRYSDQALQLLAEHPTDQDAALRFAALANRAGGADGLGNIALARQSVHLIKAESTYGKPPDWVSASAMVADGVASLLEGQDGEGRTKLRAASAFAGQCGFSWAQGTAQRLLARSLLRGDPDPNRARAALDAARCAVRVFDDQANVFDILGALYVGADALAVLSIPDAAVQVRAGVIAQAHRTGADPDRYGRDAGRETEDRMWRLAAEHPAAVEAGRSMRLADIIAFFSDTADAVVADGNRGAGHEKGSSPTPPR
jgi:predicted ATPase/DNA-binding SARP family transcriptional activator